jgi:seryl-tRNA synthetase
VTRLRPCLELADPQKHALCLASRVQHHLKPPFAIGDLLCEGPSLADKPAMKQRDPQNGWVIHLGHADVYLPDFCKLVHQVRADLCRFPFSSFHEMAFPRLLSHDVATRFGLIESWPDILLAVRAYRPTVSDRAILPRSEPYVLDPVQCANLYACLYEDELATSDVPICVRETLGGWSYRNESKAKILPLRQTTQFLRDEYIFLGAPAQVRSIRALLIDGLCGYLEQVQLPFRVVVGSGCFEMPGAELNDTLHNIRDIEHMPILDVEVRLPEDGGWVEVCGASLWEDRLVRRFGIRGRGFDLHSGCCGIGISRLCLAMLGRARVE